VVSRVVGKDFGGAQGCCNNWGQLDGFPFIKTLGGKGGSFADQMTNAEFKINRPSLLIEACKAIDAMQNG